jgi:hypothetical protein
MSVGPVQIAYAVDDVRSAALAWNERGVGPFFILDHIPLATAIVRGRPASFDHSSAYGWWGDLMVELICEHVDDDTDRIGSPTGIHHMAFFADDLERAREQMAARGRTEALYAETATGMPFVMFDPGEEFGHLVEMYERTERLAGFYEMVRSSSEGWDGTDPIREV